MADLIETPTIIAPAGNLPKRIAEFVGRVNSATDAVSIARMESPAGWCEPAQTPEFDEYTLVFARSPASGDRFGGDRCDGRPSHRGTSR
jgi:hypothetical protein